jgi:hypothetical protein
MQVREVLLQCTTFVISTTVPCHCHLSFIKQSLDVGVAAGEHLVESGCTRHLTEERAVTVWAVGVGGGGSLDSITNSQLNGKKMDFVGSKNLMFSSLLSHFGQYTDVLFFIGGHKKLFSSGKTKSRKPKCSYFSWKNAKDSTFYSTNVQFLLSFIIKNKII